MQVRARGVDFLLTVIAFNKLHHLCQCAFHDSSCWAVRVQYLSCPMIQKCAGSFSISGAFYPIFVNIWKDHVINFVSELETNWTQYGREWYSKVNRLFVGQFFTSAIPVSYTHLTLPTKRIV